MKQIRINAFEIGLVFKNGEFKKIVKPGLYWFWLSEDVYAFDTTKQFNPPIELNKLLQNTDIVNALNIIDVLDNEIVIQFQDEILTKVLTTGRNAFWKSIMNTKFLKVNLSNCNIDESIDKNILNNFLVKQFIRSVTIESFEKGILMVDNEFVKVLDAGIYQWWKNATIINVGKADLRQQQLEINGQEILTKDKAALRINAWAQYQIVDIEKALIANKDFEKQLYTILQLALRAFVCGYSFDELLDKKENIGELILATLGAQAADLGIAINTFGIRDIVLPGDIKDIMNQVLVAEKKAQANTIMRREETASTRSLLNTAKLMEDNAMLWKLKEMEYVEKIADKINTITVSGNGALVEQLKHIFVNK